MSFDLPPVTIGDLKGNAPKSKDVTCQDCGTALDYKGIGAKPKRCPECKAENIRLTSKPAPSAAPRASKDVEGAIATLSQLDTGIAMALMMLNPPAAISWAEGRADMVDRNRDILMANPKLAAQIVNTNAKAGPFALVASYAVALAPAAMQIVASRPAKSKPATPTGPRAVPSDPDLFDPDYAFNSQNG